MEYDPADPTDEVVDITSNLLDLTSIPLPSAGGDIRMSKKKGRSQHPYASNLHDIPLPSRHKSKKSKNGTHLVTDDIPLPSMSGTESQSWDDSEDVTSEYIPFITPGFRRRFSPPPSAPPPPIPPPVPLSGPVKFSIKGTGESSSSGTSIPTVNESLWNNEPQTSKLAPLPKRSKPAVLPTGVIASRRRLSDAPGASSTLPDTLDSLPSPENTSIANITPSTSANAASPITTAVKPEFFLPTQNDSQGLKKAMTTLPTPSAPSLLGASAPEILASTLLSVSNTVGPSLLGNGPPGLSVSAITAALFGPGLVQSNPTPTPPSHPISMYTAPPGNNLVQLPNPIASIPALANYPTLNMPYLNPQKLRSAQMISQPLIENPAWAAAQQKKSRGRSRSSSRSISSRSSRSSSRSYSGKRRNRRRSSTRSRDRRRSRTRSHSRSRRRSRSSSPRRRRGDSISRRDKRHRDSRSRSKDRSRRSRSPDRRPKIRRSMDRDVKKTSERSKGEKSRGRQEEEKRQGKDKYEQGKDRNKKEDKSRSKFDEEKRRDTDRSKRDEKGESEKKRVKEKGSDYKDSRDSKREDEKKKGRDDDKKNQKRESDSKRDKRDSKKEDSASKDNKSNRQRVDSSKKENESSTKKPSSNRKPNLDEGNKSRSTAKKTVDESSDDTLSREDPVKREKISSDKVKKESISKSSRDNKPPRETLSTQKKQLSHELKAKSSEKESSKRKVDEGWSSKSPSPSGRDRSSTPASYENLHSRSRTERETKLEPIEFSPNDDSRSANDTVCFESKYATNTASNQDQVMGHHNDNASSATISPFHSSEDFLNSQSTIGHGQKQKYSPNVYEDGSSPTDMAASS